MKKDKISNSIIIAKRSTGKLNAGIDYLIREIDSIAIDDSIKINTNDNKPEELLEIYASYEKFNVTAKVPYDMILLNMHNLHRFAYFIYEGLKQNFVEYFEYRENNQEHEVDEHWEFVDIGSM